MFPQQIWSNLCAVAADVHSQFLKKEPARKEWFIGLDDDQWSLTLSDSGTSRFRIQITSKAANYHWSGKDWTKFIRSILQKRNSKMSLLRGGSSQSTITIYFTEENRNFELPLGLWYNIQDCQEAVDHAVSIQLHDEWDVSEGDDARCKWTLWVTSNKAREYFVHLKGEVIGLRGAESVVDWTYEEWKKLKDCMVPSDMCADPDFRLAVYILADVIRKGIEKETRDWCPGCTYSMESLSDLTHTCIMKRRHWQQTLFTKIKSEVTLEEFKLHFRRAVEDYDLYSDSPSLLFHHILRHHAGRLRSLVICADVFGDDK